jgi:hypothetical protein
MVSAQSEDGRRLRPEFEITFGQDRSSDHPAIHLDINREVSGDDAHASLEPGRSLFHLLDQPLEQRIGDRAVEVERIGKADPDRLEGDVAIGRAINDLDGQPAVDRWHEPDDQFDLADGGPANRGCWGAGG